jgi:nucleotide-binding universal stress UspA family protein
VGGATRYWADVYAAPVLSADGAQRVRAAARRRMAAIVDQVRATEAPTLSASPHVDLRVVGGSPAGALLDAATGADLLVVGSRGRGQLARAMFGSVSLQVVLRAQCPVTVVNPAEASEPQPVR